MGGICLAIARLRNSGLRGFPYGDLLELLSLVYRPARQIAAAGCSFFSEGAQSHCGLQFGHIRLFKGLFWDGQRAFLMRQEWSSAHRQNQLGPTLLQD